ncbi:MAG: DUF4833 domain-containing protein [Endomicrobium sp.]|jgi:hypothetical protein|nr:DUF4833 domain-containing protein [Endomicrobium sp.]
MESLKIKIVMLFFISSIFISVYAFSDNKNLFKIERNKNTNIVMYDIILNSDGQIDTNNRNFIDFYWVLHAKQGQRKKITVFEKSAYGFKTRYNNNGYYELILKAVPDRIMKIIIINKIPKLETEINSRRSYLNTVYVFANNSSFMPKVLYYILTGIDIETEKIVTEKIIVKKLK